MTAGLPPLGRVRPADGLTMGGPRRPPRPRPRRWLRVAAVGWALAYGVVLAPPRDAAGDAARERTAVPPRAAAVIPPGQEDLLAAMLGRGSELPDGCAFAAGQVGHGGVRGVYNCAGAEVVIELRHPADAPDDARRTDKLAIVAAGGSPSPALLNELERIVRTREDAFEWAAPVRTRHVARPDFPERYPLFGALLVGAAQTAVIALGLGCGLIRLYRLSGALRGR